MKFIELVIFVYRFIEFVVYLTALNPTAVEGLLICFLCELFIQRKRCFV